MSYTALRNFASTRTDWANLPEFGVICVMEYDVPGWDAGGAEIHANREYYWLADGRIHHSDTRPVGVAANMIKRAPITMIPDADYAAIKDAAMQESAP